MSLARKPALNSRGMFSEPATHLLIRPGPFKGVGVPMVVFRPRSQDMRLELLLALPGRPFQVIVLERMDEDFRLVQPGGIGGRIPGFPPALTLSEIRSRAGWLCDSARRLGSGRRRVTPCAAGETAPAQGDSARRRCVARNANSISPLCTTRNTSMLTVPCRV